MNLLSYVLIAVLFIYAVITGVYTFKQRIITRKIIKTKISALNAELEQAREQQSYCKERGCLYTGNLNDIGKEISNLKKQLLW